MCLVSPLCHNTVKTDVLALQDELFQVMVTPLSELQRLWHLTDFIRGQAEHDSVPAAARLLTLQASIQDKLDALLQPHVMAELPYKSVSQLHKTLLSMLESASDSQSTNPFSQLTSICASAQDAIDFIHTHVDPINSSSASLMTGWSVFWGIALHSGIAVPATLHSRSSRMAGEPAAVTSSDIQSFTELCFATHGLVDGSDDLVFLLHMLTQDSALFQGYLMQHLKQYSNKQPGPSAWPGMAQFMPLWRDANAVEHA